jgi:hypothetical protein
MSRINALLSLAGLSLVAIAAGCGERNAPVAAQQPVHPTASKSPAAPVTADSPEERATDFPVGTAEPPSGPASETASGPDTRSSLADLAEAAAEIEFELPMLDEGKIAAAGIRKLEGKHIAIYTDIPPGPAADELPRVFDAAIPLMCDYFGVDKAKVADWKLVGSVMKDKERFVGAGLLTADLPDFPNGFSRGSQVWLFDQPSDYYRRHLLIHELAHAFMNRWLGGAGPPWYMEGMAELLGTHRWEGGKLELGYLPRHKDEVPYWGRVKIVKDEFAASRGMLLDQIMTYDAQAHLYNAPYGWCWAAAAFLDQHPKTQAAFRELKHDTADRSVEFSNRFRERLKEHWGEIDEDWQLFVIECDYGYDVARAAALRQPTADLPAGGATATIAADRGWQSTGYKLKAGTTYELTASGRYQVATDPKPWPCEANGITIRYHRGQPLGLLQAAVSDEETPRDTYTPLSAPTSVGVHSVITPETGGTLFLRINEAASGLADNSGTLNVEIRPQP